ncbi:MAG: PIN domain-containing protein [Candidatus Solibacter usitatus]|nr:PIN domain-containing protein [Candidatus Solibacter usitatus]
MRAFLDTTVLVAAFDGNDPRHERAKDVILRGGPKRTFAAVHAMAECYACLTSQPRRPRIQPTQVERFLEDLRKYVFFIELSQEEYLLAMNGAAEKGLTGGIIYDALHVESARKAKAQTIYTYNRRHFMAVAPELAGRIVAP